MAEKIIFFTGAPGFIGNKIIEKLLEENNNLRINLLVLKSSYKTAVNLFKNNEKFKGKIELLIGDVSKPKFNLNDEVYSELTQKTTDIFHLAAIYSVEVPKKIAWKVNVIGTKNIINFALKCSKLEIFIFFSSIVAAGIVKGDIYEDNLDTNCKFHYNYYEQTKFASEVLVRRYFNKLPIIIIRPGIAIGDSKSGETDKFDGMYYFFYFLPLLKLIPIFTPNTDFYVPLVPVDYVADATCYISNNKGCIGHCFHIGEFDLTIFQVLDSLTNRKVDGVKIHIPKKLFEMIINLPFYGYLFRLKIIKLVFKKLLRLPTDLLAQFDSLTFCRYRTDNSKKYLEPAGIMCPKFKNYAKNILEFFKNNKKNPNLRR